MANKSPAIKMSSTKPVEDFMPKPIAINGIAITPIPLMPALDSPIIKALNSASEPWKKEKGKSGSQEKKFVINVTL